MGVRKNYFEKVAAASEGKIVLAEAALQIAVSEYPELDVPHYLSVLKDWSGQLKRELTKGPVHLQLDKLNDWLFGIMNFSGDTENYYDPRNSFLNDVIDRRKGIPISLSVIYLELAWALGIDASGIGFPGHFLVRVMAEGKPLYIDTFHGGNIMTAEGCAAFLKELTEGELEFSDSFLTRVTKKDIIGRMLRNLKRIYLETSAYPKLIQVLDKLVLLYPESPEEVRDRGIIQYQLKAFRSSLHDFENFLSMAPESEDADMIHQYVEILREYNAHLN